MFTECSPLLSVKQGKNVINTLTITVTSVTITGNYLMKLEQLCF